MLKKMRLKSWPGENEKLIDLFTELVGGVINQGMIDKISKGEVSRAQFETLKFILRHKNCTVGDISEGLGVNYPSATKLVERLKKRGWIRRTKNEKDRRMRSVLLTPRGRKITLAILKAKREALNNLILRMGEEGRKELLRGLKIFLEVALEKESLIDRVCLRCGKEHKLSCPLNALHRKRVGRHIEKV